MITLTARATVSLTLCAISIASNLYAAHQVSKRLEAQDKKIKDLKSQLDNEE